MDKYLLYFIIILLFLSYFNIFVISGTPPFFSEGYINRIGYLEETKLWFVLRPFGAVLIIIPIILGYLKASRYYYFKSSLFLYILFILYFSYLIFIGQKFSGLLLGIFYFILPQVILMIQQKKKLITLNRISIVLFIGVFFFVVLVLHYSTNPIALDMGGPIKFIFYRIFALQGHMSWGYYNYYDLLNFEPSKMYNAMHNMMETVGDPAIVESMFERNVNFTGAFPTIVFFSFPIGINLLVLIVIFYLYTKFSFYILKSIDTVYYIFLMYIFNYVNTYFSRGSIEEIINYKVLILILLISIIKMLLFISAKKRNKIGVVA